MNKTYNFICYMKHDIFLGMTLLLFCIFIIIRVYCIEFHFKSFWLSHTPKFFSSVICPMQMEYGINLMKYAISSLHINVFQFRKISETILCKDIWTMFSIYWNSEKMFVFKIPFEHLHILQRITTMACIPFFEIKSFSISFKINM